MDDNNGDDSEGSSTSGKVLWFPCNFVYKMTGNFLKVFTRLLEALCVAQCAPCDSEAFLDSAVQRGR